MCTWLRTQYSFSECTICSSISNLHKINQRLITKYEIRVMFWVMYLHNSFTGLNKVKLNSCFIKMIWAIQTMSFLNLLVLHQWHTYLSLSVTLKNHFPCTAWKNQWSLHRMHILVLLSNFFVLILLTSKHKHNVIYDIFQVYNCVTLVFINFVILIVVIDIPDEIRHDV